MLAIAFLLGTVIGAGVMIILSFRAIDGALVLSKLNLESDARVSAARAWCDHRFADAVPFGWTAATLAAQSDPDGVQRKLAVLTTLIRLSDQKHRSNAEALKLGDIAFARSKLALILDRAGLPTQAEAEWAAASNDFARIDKQPTRDLVAAALDRECEAMSLRSAH